MHSIGSCIIDSDKRIFSTKVISSTSNIFHNSNYLVLGDLGGRHTHLDHLEGRRPSWRETTILVGATILVGGNHLDYRAK